MSYNYYKSLISFVFDQTQLYMSSPVADHPCEKGKTKCPNSNKCLARRYLCDGDDDCGDNSDENPLFCKSVACTDGKMID